MRLKNKARGVHAHAFRISFFFVERSILKIMICVSSFFFN